MDWRDEPSGYTGFKNQNGQIVIPATFRSSPGFYEGLASVTFDDETRGFIKPDGSIAFSTGKDSSMGFVNGRAMLHRLTTNSNGKTELYFGFIDKDGNRITDIIYQYAESFVGETGNEYALVYNEGFLSPINNFFTNDREESISLYDFFIPAWSPLFIDKDGNTVPIKEVRASIKRLTEQAKLKKTQ
ncbi:MAG: WG repeat-containing protein [Phycisphaerales bacterium]|nr:WG repeat-containing protein [Phycisphaerales bacterium]